MKRLCLSAILLLPLLAAPAAGQDEKGLERRVRRFYTYYYLNHYDDMWGCFHASLRERLGDDRKAYIQNLRRSDLELFEAEILDVHIQEDRGVVDVDLTFFYRNVGNPIPRRHRMLWIWEDDQWWYAGSQLVEGQKALKGEVVEAEPAEPEPEAPAVADRPPQEEPARPETAVAAAPPEIEQEPPPAPEVDEAPATAEDAELAAAPAGLPEEVPGKAGMRPDGERYPGALLARLTSMSTWNRTNKLRALEPDLGPGDVGDLLEAARTAGHPVGHWSLAWAARLGVRHPEVRDEAIEGLSEFLVMGGLRVTAASGLGWLKAVEVRQALEKLVFGAGPPVGRAAVGALGNIGDPRSADVLISAWQRRVDPSMRSAILEALGPCYTPEGGEILLGVASSKQIPLPERLAAARSLALLSPPEALEPLQTLDEALAGQTPKHTWRLRLLTLAGRIRHLDPVASESILQVLEFERPNQPTAEAMELGRALGGAGDLETAGVLLADASASARYAGAIALREMAALGVDGAAEAAREAAHGERNSLVASTLRGAQR
jgi:hypothetical protein